MRIALLVLALSAAGAAHASREANRVPGVLRIEGMEPITAVDLTRFTGLAAMPVN